jgi:hypothetical protein
LRRQPAFDVEIDFQFAARLEVRRRLLIADRRVAL